MPICVRYHAWLQLLEDFPSAVSRQLSLQPLHGRRDPGLFGGLGKAVLSLVELQLYGCEFLFFFFCILFFFFFIVVDFVIHWNETALGLHVSFLLESPLIKLRLCFLSPANCVSIWFSQHSQAKRSCGSPLRHLSGCLYLNFGQIMYTHHQSLVFIIQECVSYSVLDIHKMIIMFQ